jgi:uncharacterized membrane protein
MPLLEQPGGFRHNISDPAVASASLMTDHASLPVPTGELPGVSFRRRFFPIAALVLLIIGTALRVYQLGDRSLWFDEALTANISRGTLTQALDETRSRCSAPVVHPYLLYLVEKFGRGPVAVRAPSVLASILAVVMMLAMVRVKVSHNAALFSAAILAMSASQIRYAQEVREYSLSVLFAACLIFCFLRWEVTGSRSRNPALLYAALFLAPLVQYGLVFLAFGILSAILLRVLLTRETCFRFFHIVIGSSFLALGGLLSLRLTLRYQFHPGGVWYLAAQYYDPKTKSLLHFLATNSKELLTFFIPGQVVALCFALAAIVFCVSHFITRKYEPITLLLFTSVPIVICASVARVYPYGGVRQCLFLAPVLTLFAGVIFADLLRRLRGSLQSVATVAFLVLIILSGYRGMLRQWPYGEYEDTLSILKELSRSTAPADQVWVNHDAVPAIDFYVQGKDRRFIYGKFHNDPREYVPELLGSIDPNGDRLWLVFSHLQQTSDRSEEELIVNTLRLAWEVDRVLAPTNSALYVVHRRTST